MRLLTCILISIFMISCSSSSKNSKSNNQKNIKTRVSAPKVVQLYKGAQLPSEEVVRILAEQSDSRFMYFIGFNGKKVKSPSLVDGPREVRVKPGAHSLRMRFVAKGKLAIPLKPFEKIKFSKGKTYIVKSKFVLGQGDYITSAKNTKVTVWIEEVGSSKKLGLMTLNGFGR